jgi:uncharacterized protein (DUF1697 family)
VSLPLTFGFLRAVNVGGRQMRMADLVDTLSSLGLRDVAAFIASGNVIFADDGRDPPSLRATIEDAIEANFGFRAEIFLRSRADLQAITHQVAIHREEDDVATNIAFIEDSPREAMERAFAPYQSDIERFVIYDHYFIWLAKVKMSETPFFYKSTKSKTSPLMTMRNYNTIERMLAKWG